jgi:hypothetical protein
MASGERRKCKGCDIFALIRTIGIAQIIARPRMSRSNQRRQPGLLARRS